MTNATPAAPFLTHNSSPPYTPATTQSNAAGCSDQKGEEGENGTQMEIYHATIATFSDTIQNYS